MSASTSNVVTLYETNVRDTAATLRKLANAIENGIYGEVSEVALVLLGDRMELFGMGPSCDGTSTHALLHAGMLRIALELENHGRE